MMTFRFFNNGVKRYKNLFLYKALKKLQIYLIDSSRRNKNRALFKIVMLHRTPYIDITDNDTILTENVSNSIE